MNNRDKFADYEALPLVLEVKDIQNILGISRTRSVKTEEKYACEDIYRA